MEGGVEVARQEVLGLAVGSEAEPLKDLLVLVHLAELRLQILVHRVHADRPVGHRQVPHLHLQEVPGSQVLLVFSEGGRRVVGDDLGDEVLGSVGLVLEVDGSAVADG